MSFALARALACLLLLATSQAIATDRPWKLVVTPQYRVLSQLRDGETDGWIRNFDQFILSTSDVLQMDVNALPPLTVVLFDRDKDYTPYKLQRANGRAANVSGQFVRRQTWSMIGMAHENDNAELRRILQHEATHWLMSADQARQPAWFTEGIAEMFSTFERKGDHVDWGKPIGSHLGLLRTSGTMPLAELLVEPTAIFDRDERTERFYAQSWLFTHFLMLSKDASRRPRWWKRRLGRWHSARGTRISRGRMRRRRLRSMGRRRMGTPCWRTSLWRSATSTRRRCTRRRRWNAGRRIAIFSFCSGIRMCMGRTRPRPMLDRCG